MCRFTGEVTERSDLNFGRPSLDFLNKNIEFSSFSFVENFQNLQIDTL